MPEHDAPASEGRWTPGPWRVMEGPRHTPIECDISIGGDIFILAHIRGPNYDHCQANAHLIAAAPAMAEALRDAAVELDRLRGNIDSPEDDESIAEVTRDIEAALALAEGHTP